jgi:hypothetical protein
MAPEVSIDIDNELDFLIAERLLQIAAERTK